MVGGRREEEVAGRLRKPVSDTVVGGMGAVGALPGGILREAGQEGASWMARTWTLSTASVEGAENPMRGATR
jgi:hypothetical protein